MSRSPTSTADRGRAAERRAVLAVLGAAVCFGGTFVVVRAALGGMGAMAFVALRFGLASAILWPFARRRPATPGLWRDSLPAGLTLLAGYVLQTLGLKTVPSSVSAFLTELLVVMVPIGVALRTRRPPRLPVLIGVLLAVGGLWLLTGADVGFSVGVFLTLGCAAAFALNILALSEVAPRHDPVRLALAQLVVVAAGAFLASLGVGGWSLQPLPFLAAGATAIFASAIAFALQAAGQRVLPASRVSLLLLGEPLTAAVLGAALGVRLSPAGWAGAALIGLGVGISEGMPAPPRGAPRPSMDGVAPSGQDGACPPIPDCERPGSRSVS